jgi:hypothetical protein
MPTHKHTYECRAEPRTREHCLGKVGYLQFFGLVESLMKFNANQVPCSRAYAEEDDTKLLYLTPSDLMLVFTIEQIDMIVE